VDVPEERLALVPAVQPGHHLDPGRFPVRLARHDSVAQAGRRRQVRRARSPVADRRGRALRVRGPRSGAAPFPSPRSAIQSRAERAVSLGESGMTPEETARRAKPAVFQLGAAFGADATFDETARRLGLSHWAFYFGARAGVLGRVDAEVVTA